MTDKNCFICNHAAHENGKCKQCNCGESELIHASDDYFSLEADYGDYLHYQVESRKEDTKEKGEYKLCR